jgi:glycosyltransferase involved in cell wall biosynthesis
MPTFSIILPTYNSAETIAECIDSVLAQTFKDYEVLVMDGLSTDETLNIIQGYKDERIKIYSAKDEGVYDAMNKGIGLANGEWLYFLGSDDTLYNEAVFLKVHEAIEENDSDIIYGNSYFTCLQIFHGKHFNRRDLSRKDNICHQSIFYHKNVFKRLGRYNLNFPVYADWDFNIRCFSTPDLRIKYIDVTIARYNDATGVSSSGWDLNYARVSAFGVLYEKESVLESKEYKLGSFLLYPIRKLQKLFRK